MTYYHSSPSLSALQCCVYINCTYHNESHSKATLSCFLLCTAWWGCTQDGQLLRPHHCPISQFRPICVHRITVQCTVIIFLLFIIIILLTIVNHCLSLLSFGVFFTFTIMHCFLCIRTCTMNEHVFEYLNIDYICISVCFVCASKTPA